MARTDQPHKLTFDAFVAKCSDFTLPVNEKHRALDYTKPETRAAWNGSKSKIPIWCKIHKTFFTQQGSNHMNGQGCPDCGSAVKIAKRRKADPVADFRRVHGERYDYSQMRYVSTHTPITIVCHEHGPFQMKPLFHLQGGNCQQCRAGWRDNVGAIRTAGYVDTFAERAARLHKGAYAIIRMPEHAFDKAILNCPKHGDFEQKAYSHLAGHGCPRCGKIISYTQLEVAEFVAGLGVPIEHDNRTVLGGYHIDIWLPSINLGIEYNGAFWHTEERVGNKHREKWEIAQAVNVRLIQIFDFEWIERRSAVENRLRSLIGGSKAVGARSCELREVERAEAAKFLNAWHTQGTTPRAEVAYALFHDGQMVACMTFGRGRFHASGWELLRYASLGRVQGGFSRLLAAFIAARDPDEIRSYCDLRWGDGRVYAQAGFVMDHITAPDYWYTKSEKRVSRYSAQNRPKGQSEKEWAAENGCLKVLGVGHQRWVWRKP